MALIHRSLRTRAGVVNTAQMVLWLGGRRRRLYLPFSGIWDADSGVRDILPIHGRIPRLEPRPPSKYDYPGPGRFCRGGTVVGPPGRPAWTKTLRSFWRHSYGYRSGGLVFGS